MHVALTGVSGFIGSTIARHLKQAGHTITGLVRAESRRDHIGDAVDRFVVGDQADRAAFGPLLQDADCLIHNSVDWAPLKDGDLSAHLDRNVVAAIELIDAARPRPVVFMSSIAVHHDMRPRWDGTIDEDHPARPGSLYGAGKAAVEMHLFAQHATAGVPFAALRPCAVYGLDPRPERSVGYPIIQRVARDRRFERPGGGKFVHVDDVAAVTVAAAVAAVGDSSTAIVCNLADCYARWGDLAVMAAEMLGVEAEVDLSSPAAPRNTFTKDVARGLGVGLDRGLDGLRDHLRALMATMEVTPARRGS